MLLDEISTSENMVRGTLDELHMASVQLFQDNLKSLLDDRSFSGAQAANLVHLPLTSTLH
jgi:hypothetical protein